MARRPMPTPAQQSVIDEIVAQAVDMTAEIDDLLVQVDTLRRQRRRLYLRAFKKGAWYQHIAEAVGVDDVNIYRQITKAREEAGE